MGPEEEGCATWYCSAPCDSVLDGDANKAEHDTRGSEWLAGVLWKKHRGLGEKKTCSASVA